MSGFEPGTWDAGTITDRAVAVYRDATERIEAHQRAVEQLGRERALALAVLYDSGLSLKKIGKLVGLSAPRVGQMIASLGRGSRAS